MFSGFDNMSYTRKYSKSHQKINGTYYFETTPADRFKIEIPINKISATYNKDNKVNKLVTVFADILSEQSQIPNQFR
jgi:chitinase